MTRETTIEKTYKMAPEDWQPLVDAMKYLKNLPQCGDVAGRLEAMFSAAQNGKYYFIEMGYEGQDNECLILGMNFDGNPEEMGI